MCFSLSLRVALIFSLFFCVCVCVRRVAFTQSGTGESVANRLFSTNWHFNPRIRWLFSFFFSNVFFFLLKKIFLLMCYLKNQWTEGDFDRKEGHGERRNPIKNDNKRVCVAKQEWDRIEFPSGFYVSFLSRAIQTVL